MVKVGVNKVELEMLQEWFKSQTKYKTQKEFAKAAGIPRSTMGHYIRGNETPSEERRKRLYEITGLECFKSELKIPEKKEEKKTTEIKEHEKEKELPMHLQLQNWFESQTKYKTRKNLAKAAGIGYSNLSKYFRGEIHPSKDIGEKLYKITGLEILRQEEEIKELERSVEIKTPLYFQETAKELQNIVFELSEKVDNFEEICEKCIANKLPSSSDQSSVRERVEIVKELLYALNRELEFFKHVSAENREIFRKRIHASDVGYITALLRALFDEDKFQSWLYMSDFRMKRR